MTKEKFFYATHPLGGIFTGPSECGESCFQTILVSKIVKECEISYIYSPSLCQNLCQKLNKCFNNYISINVVQNILNEKDKDVVTDEIVFDKEFKSQTPR